MQRKPNEAFIREYSEQFSRKITSVFFADIETISGKEILNVSPSKQVNFFILMVLFAKWQDEIKKLESPYFNYRDSEVRRAMVDFMNTLSQHIKMDREHFLPLAKEAVMKTLMLLVAPQLFLQREFGGKNVSVVNEKIVKPIFKYLKLHKEYLDRFLTDNSGEDVDTFLENAWDYFTGLDLDDAIKEELAKLSEVVPITLGDLTAEEDEGNFEIEDAAEDLDEEPFQDEEVIPASSQYEDETDDEALEELADDQAYSDETQEEDKEPDTADDQDAASRDETLNEKFTPPKASTLNDRFTGEQEQSSLAEQMQKRKVTNIMEAISVNHRYMFTKELFDGDREAFNKAIAGVETCESFDDAVELLVENFARERGWDMNSDEVKELLKMIFRKFR